MRTHTSARVYLCLSVSVSLSLPLCTHAHTHTSARVPNAPRTACTTHFVPAWGLQTQDGRPVPWSWKTHSYEEVLGPEGWCNAEQPLKHVDCLPDGLAGATCGVHTEQVRMHGAGMLGLARPCCTAAVSACVEGTKRKGRLRSYLDHPAFHLACHSGCWVNGEEFHLSRRRYMLLPLMRTVLLKLWWLWLGLLTKMSTPRPGRK